MEFLEEAVMNYLTWDQKTFVIPQYSVGMDGEWSRPDFVAIRPSDKICLIVEVSVSYDLQRLAEKIKDKEKQWISELKEQLETLQVIKKNENWRFIVLAFVREDRFDWLNEKLANEKCVKVLKIEDTFDRWNWTEEMSLEKHLNEFSGNNCKY